LYDCAEFQAVLPDLLEDGGGADQRTHLALCPACSELVSEINIISRQAPLLRASDEPSPRVWNSIEIALRQEGLIREPGATLVRLPRILYGTGPWPGCYPQLRLSS